MDSQDLPSLAEYGSVHIKDSSWGMFGLFVVIINPWWYYGVWINTFYFCFFNEKIYRFSFLEKQRLPGHEGYSKRLQGQARVEEVHEETDAFCASSKGTYM